MKKLYRSKSDRIILGVCGGLGEYSGINSNIIRFIFVLSALFFGPLNIILYFILASVLPEEGQEYKNTNRKMLVINGLSTILSTILKRLNEYSSKGFKDSKINVSRFKQKFNNRLNDQILKNKSQQFQAIKLAGHQNRFGISFDWRSIIMIIILIIAILFLLWKFGLIGNNFNLNFINKF